MGILGVPKMLLSVPKTEIQNHFPVQNMPQTEEINRTPNAWHVTLITDQNQR